MRENLEKFGEMGNFVHFGVTPTSTVGPLTPSDGVSESLFVKPGRKRKVRRVRKVRKSSGPGRKAMGIEEQPVLRLYKLADGVSDHPPGSGGRVDDLAKFYNLAECFGEDAPSAFN